MKKFFILMILILSVLLTKGIPRTRYIENDVYAEEEYFSSEKQKDSIIVPVIPKETTIKSSIVHEKNEDLFNENQKDLILIALTVISVFAILYMRTKRVEKK